MKPKITKRMGMEGNSFAKLAQTITSIGYNPGLQIGTAQVTGLNPLRITEDSGELELDPDEYIINTDLLPKKETVLIDGIARVIEYPNELEIGQKFLVAVNYDDPEGMTYIIAKI